MSDSQPVFNSRAFGFHPAYRCAMVFLWQSSGGVMAPWLSGEVKTPEQRMFLVGGCAAIALGFLSPLRADMADAGDGHAPGADQSPGGYLGVRPVASGWTR